MCRYGFYNYKLTYGCFKCQVGFKRPLPNDILGEKLRKEIAKDGFTDKDFKCPNCGGEMANLGRDLRLPTKTKDEQWRAIKYLYDNKYNIYSCGCQGIGFVPHKLSEAIELVEETKFKRQQFLDNEAKKEKQEAKAKARKKRANALKIRLQLRAVKKEDE
jgi:hypothetical protein